MADSGLSGSADPQFPDYAFAADPLVHVYRRRTGSAKVATVFIGEWMKVVETGGAVPTTGRVQVAFRGGRGYVDPTQLTRSRHLEIFFIDVEQGDSILIQTPDDRRVLIDGGQGDDAYQFIVTKYALDKEDHYVDFEAVIATHSDADHTQGLLKVLRDRRIAVKRVYHNGLWRRTDGSQDPGRVRDGRVYGLASRPTVNATPPLKSLMRRFVQAVDRARQNLPQVISKMRALPRWQGKIDPNQGPLVFKRLDAADGFVPPYDAANPTMTMEVLWPCASGTGAQRSYPWYGDAGKTVNGNSIVLRVSHGRNVILLTGDLNTASMDDLRAKCRGQRRGRAGVLRADVYKAAHHGSQHFSVDFLRAVKPNAAVISSGDNRYDVHGHPRAVLMGTITRHSRVSKPAVFATELAACFRKLTAAQQREAQYGRGRLYERAIQGVVHLRSNGSDMYLGTVFGRRPPEAGRHAQTTWKWDVWPGD